ncbi:MAG: sprT domain-containing protein [Chloroflexota bacterium]
MKPTQAQFEAYQQLFDYFNKTLFDDSLPDCILSFSRRRSSSHTLFTAEQWQEASGGARPEISLNLKQMVEAEMIEVMATLVREMVHLWQEQFGHPGRKGYYNREWADKMAAIGLIPSDTGEPGGKRTGQGIRHYIEEGGRFERAFAALPAAYRWPFSPRAVWEEGEGGYSEKVMYQCVGCGVKVWGKSGLGLVCECGQVFEAEGGPSQPGLAEKVYRILAEQYALMSARGQVQ